MTVMLRAARARVSKAGDCCAGERTPTFGGRLAGGGDGLVFVRAGPHRVPGKAGCETERDASAGANRSVGRNDLPANFAARIGGRMDIEVPLAVHQIGRLSVGQGLLAFDRAR